MGAYGAGTARRLTDGARRLEPIEFTGSNADPGDHYVHDEDEFFTVLEGTVIVSLGDHGVSTLGPGDSLYCPSGTPHRWHSAHGSRYRLLIVKEAFGSHRTDGCGVSDPDAGSADSAANAAEQDGSRR
jgi:quercetin dioxygenase-like cupin family protein